MTSDPVLRHCDVEPPLHLNVSPSNSLIMNDYNEGRKDRQVTGIHAAAMQSRYLLGRTIE